MYISFKPRQITSITFKSALDTTFNQNELEIHRFSQKIRKSKKIAWVLVEHSLTVVRPGSELADATLRLACLRSRVKLSEGSIVEELQTTADYSQQLVLVSWSCLCCSHKAGSGFLQLHPVFLDRWFPADGCEFSSPQWRLSQILCLLARLRLLWWCNDREREEEMAGSCQIRPGRYEGSCFLNSKKLKWLFRPSLPAHWTSPTSQWFI